MIYRVREIERDVRTVLDENRRSESLVSEGDVETLELDALIRSKIEMAAVEVERAAPYWLLGAGHVLDGDLYWQGDGSMVLELPDDFMRLVELKMSDWERGVHEVVTVGDAEYERQRSRYKGLRGTPQRPVAALVGRSTGNVLELYSSRSAEATIERGRYLPWPKVDSDGGIDLSERCYMAVVYMTAGLVCLSYGEYERSKALAGQAMETLGLGV